MIEREAQQQATTQRLWIGGLNPPSLTVEMVQERIKSSLSDKLDGISFDGNISKDDVKSKNMWGEDNRTFFFVTAKSKGLQDGETQSTPLQIISKQYNRVKWKGCVLQVEQAKLHFLQRLELERREASKAKANRIEVDQNIDDITQDQKIFTKRHLRIRKQHGVEAYVVDTKPIETKDWKESMFTIKKQRSKYQKHEDKLIEMRKKKNVRQKSHIEKGHSKLQDENHSLQSKSFLNRAVRLSIPGNIDKVINEVGDTMKDSIFDAGKFTKEEVSEKHDQSSLGNMINEDDETEESEVNSISQNGGEGEYEWSDSSSDEDDASDAGQKDLSFDKNFKPFAKHKHNAFDEFESALIDQPENFDDMDVSDKIHEEDIDSLENDVISNLKLLTQLYPDIKVRSQKESKCLTDSSPDHKVKPGWKSSCLIQRYDPNALTENDNNEDIVDLKTDDVDTSIPSSESDSNMMEKDLLKNVESDKDSNADEIDEELPESKDHLDHENDDIQLNEMEVGKNYIYEQKKLENIFQQERSGQGTTNFNFSSMFQLGAEEKDSKMQSSTAAKVENDSGFKFSFGTLDKAEEDVPNEDVHHNDAAAAEINEDLHEAGISSSKCPTTPTELTERCKFFYSTGDLARFQEKFLKLHGGVELVLSLQQNSKKRDAEKEQWQEERKTLTLDWKRKQKYALSKRKRMKYSR